MPRKKCTVISWWMDRMVKPSAANSTSSTAPVAAVSRSFPVAPPVRSGRAWYGWAWYGWSGLRAVAGGPSSSRGPYGPSVRRALPAIRSRPPQFRRIQPAWRTGGNWFRSRSEPVMKSPTSAGPDGQQAQRDGEPATRGVGQRRRPPVGRDQAVHDGQAEPGPARRVAEEAAERHVPVPGAHPRAVVRDHHTDPGDVRHRADPHRAAGW